MAVSKEGSHEQREVWDGRGVGVVTPTPPKPRNIFTARCLQDICIDTESPLYLMKRDARSWFNALRAPEALWQWLGMPPLSVCELLRAEPCSGIDDLKSFFSEDDCCELTEGMTVRPVKRTWPMGQPWSSYVAQETLVQLAYRAGLSDASVLANDRPVPKESVELWAAVVDDLIHFSSSLDVSHERGKSVDESFPQAGAELNNKKSLTGVLEGDVVGVSYDGNMGIFEPKAASFHRLLMASLYLVRHGVASPAVVRKFNGQWGWRCEMAPHFYSILEQAYVYGNDMRVRTAWAPAQVLQEYLILSALAPLFVIDASRTWLPFITASDASSCHAGGGLGVCVASAPVKVVMEAGRLAEKRGDYIRVMGQPLDSAGPSRVGSPHELPLQSDSFKELFALRAKTVEHIGFMEAEAALLQLRWVTRASKNQSSRLLTLSDSKEVVCSVAKGRSSSPRLNLTLRKIAALLAAADIVMRVLYIPSCQNPADAPSRRWHRVRARTQKEKQKRLTRWEKMEHELLQIFQQIDDSGQW